MNRRSGVRPPPRTKMSGQPSLLKSPTEPPPFIGPEGVSGAGISVKATPAAFVVSTNRGVALGAAFTLSSGRQTTSVAATIRPANRYLRFISFPSSAYRYRCFLRGAGHSFHKTPWRYRGSSIDQQSKLVRKIGREALAIGAVSLKAASERPQRRFSEGHC